MDYKSKAEKMKYDEFSIPEGKNALNEAPSKEQTQQPSVPVNQQPPSTKKEIQISQQTKERAEACKLYIESSFIYWSELVFIRVFDRKVHENQAG